MELLVPDPAQEAADVVADRGQALQRLSMLIQRLAPLDRQIIVSYLERHAGGDDRRDHRHLPGQRRYENPSH